MCDSVRVCTCVCLYQIWHLYDTINNVQTSIGDTPTNYVSAVCMCKYWHWHRYANTQSEPLHREVLFIYKSTNTTTGKNKFIQIYKYKELYLFTVRREEGEYVKVDKDKDGWQSSKNNRQRTNYYHYYWSKDGGFKLHTNTPAKTNLPIFQLLYNRVGFGQVSPTRKNFEKQCRQ